MAQVISMKNLSVIALGGNALLKGGEMGTIEEQEKNTRATCQELIKLIKNGIQPVITHGNGPQVGNILLRNYAGFTNYQIPQMPLDICVADSQGGIGYMIARQLINVLEENKMPADVVTVLTQIIVNQKDKAFKNPTKPIGPFYSEEETVKFKKENGWSFAPDPRDRGYRRVVASPAPVDIVEYEAIKKTLEAGNIVIAAGGGGIPVVKAKKLERVEAVIDKDLASSLLAQKIGADSLYIVTDVQMVYQNFNKPTQKEIKNIRVKELEALYKRSDFPAGSMGPKIKAVIDFINQGGREAVITDTRGLNNPNKRTTVSK